MPQHMTCDLGKGIFLSAFLFCLGVFLLIVFRRNSFKLTVDSMVGVNATIQIPKDEIRIAINDNQSFLLSYSASSLSLTSVSMGISRFPVLLFGTKNQL